MAEEKVLGLPRNVAIIGGTVAVAAAYFLFKKRTATSTTNTPTQVAATDSTGYNPSDLAAATSQMAPQVPTYASVGGSTVQGVTPTAPPYSPPTGETLVGSGYGPPRDTNVVVASDQHTYQSLTQTQAQQLRAAGYALYYQILPGVFTPIGNTQLLANTSQWTRLS